MKASELITKLQDMIDQHGDLKVMATYEGVEAEISDGLDIVAVDQFRYNLSEDKNYFVREKFEERVIMLDVNC